MFSHRLFLGLLGSLYEDINFTVYLLTISIDCATEWIEKKSENSELNVHFQTASAKRDCLKTNRLSEKPVDLLKNSVSIHNMLNRLIPPSILIGNGQQG